MIHKERGDIKWKFEVRRLTRPKIQIFYFNLKSNPMMRPNKVFSFLSTKHESLWDFQSSRQFLDPFRSKKNTKIDLPEHDLNDKMSNFHFASIFLTTKLSSSFSRICGKLRKSNELRTIDTCLSFPRVVKMWCSLLHLRLTSVISAKWYQHVISNVLSWLSSVDFQCFTSPQNIP